MANYIKETLISQGILYYLLHRNPISKSRNGRVQYRNKELMPLILDNTKTMCNVYLMEIIKLTSELYFFRLTTGHVYLCLDKDGLTLIDSGIPGLTDQFAEAIKGLGYSTSDLRRIVLTHYHVDHSGSAAEILKWGDIDVFAHQDDVPYIQGDKKGPPPDLLDWERPIYEQVSVDIEPDPVQVTHKLNDGDILDFGGGAKIISVPGHTPGSIAIHLAKPNVLITGDAVARMPDGQVILGVFNIDPTQAAASFQRLVGLNPQIVCFGHGEPIIENASSLLEEAALQYVA